MYGKHGKKELGLVEQEVSGLEIGKGGTPTT